MKKIPLLLLLLCCNCSRSLRCNTLCKLLYSQLLVVLLHLVIVVQHVAEEDNSDKNKSDY